MGGLVLNPGVVGVLGLHICVRFIVGASEEYNLLRGTFLKLLKQVAWNKASRPGHGIVRLVPETLAVHIVEYMEEIALLE